MIEAIIFDFDGTLADTKDRQFQWYKHWSRMSENEHFGFNMNFLKEAQQLEKKLGGEELKTFVAQLKENPGDLVLVPDFETFIYVYNELINKTDVQTVYDAFNLPCDMSDYSHPVWPAFNDYNIRHPAPLFAGIQEAVQEIWEITRLPEDAKYTDKYAWQ